MILILKSDRRHDISCFRSKDTKFVSLLYTKSVKPYQVCLVYFKSCHIFSQNYSTQSFSSAFNLDGIDSNATAAAAEYKKWSIELFSLRLADRSAQSLSYHAQNV